MSTSATTKPGPPKTIVQGFWSPPPSRPATSARSKETASPPPKKKAKKASARRKRPKTAGSKSTTLAPSGSGVPPGKPPKGGKGHRRAGKGGKGSTPDKSGSRRAAQEGPTSPIPGVQEDTHRPGTAAQEGPASEKTDVHEGPGSHMSGGKFGPVPSSTDDGWRIRERARVEQQSHLLETTKTMNDENADGTNGVSKGRTGTQNEAALLALMETTGYNMVQENGQRKFGGPPPGWEGPPPPRGCEVFVGKIPRDMYEDELVPVFERAGKIYEFRLMMEFSGENRGYAFVMYTTKEEAQLAIRMLNNYEIRPGKFIGVCVSLDNCRLFIGAIPKEKKKEEIFDEMKKVTEGVVDVIVYPSATDKTKNRGFAFVEYESHRAAAMARRKLIPGTFQLWGHTIQVDWADPEKEVDEETMQRVKVLYVRNLMISTTEETIKAEFNKFKAGAVERVKKLRDYAFVHFFNREDAVSAIEPPFRKRGGPGVSMRDRPERKPPGSSSRADPKHRKRPRRRGIYNVRSSWERSRLDPKALTVPTRDEDRWPRGAYA
ncbi:hypothetical protein NDU88_003911 [Pleurodeles waltl]|uniref:Probable RNA-binding protein 46 n=1 Tax=Pleurodeles waltl TaxID=8319 RepID=A0AAV7WQD7_PLEWA|nr:hypothetical protein NDU88_003911 [Pleurodeles waltl]